MKTLICLAISLLYYEVSPATNPKKIKVSNSFCSASNSGCSYALIYKNDSGMRLDFYNCSGQLLVSRNFHSYLRPKKDELCEQSNMIHGEEIKYSPGGQITERRMYRRGRLNGACTTYHENGKISGKGNYHDGIKDGLFSTYDTAGRLLYSQTYVDGSRSAGIWQASLPGGFTSVSLYKAGKHISTTVLHHTGDTSSVYWFRYENNEKRVSSMHIYKENRLYRIRSFSHDYRDSFFNKHKLDSMNVKETDTVNNRYISFVGGSEALLDYISENTEYPESARSTGKTGVVLVNMFFGREGILLDVFSRSEADKVLVNEAIKVIWGTDGRWLHALKQGIPALAIARIPIYFEIDE